MKKSYITSTPIETKQLAKKMASKFTGGEVLCLYGDLGSGKTVFAQGMINYFLPKKRVLSPTFIIVRHYQIDHQIIKRFLHIDLYRMTDIKEIRELEFFEYLNQPDTIVAIEWAEKLEKLLPQKRIDVHIRSLDENRREIMIIKQSHSGKPRAHPES